MDGSLRYRRLKQWANTRRVRSISHLRNTLIESFGRIWRRQCSSTVRLRKGFLVLLAAILKNDLEHQARRGLPLTPMQQVLLTLRFYATASFHQVIGDLFGMSNYAVCKVILKAVHFISSRFPWDEEKLLRQSRIPLWLHTCQVYMNWVGSSIAVDDPTHRMSGREVKKGSKLYCRKSN